VVRDSRPWDFKPVEGDALRLRVQDIAAEHEFEGLTPEQIVREFPRLTLGKVHAGLSYFFDHRDEILAEIKADEDFAESTRHTFPLPESLRR
jgi:uncharacterized protein (DUF433 family)